MTAEEIKERLEILKDFANNEISDYVYDSEGYEYEIINNAINKVLDYITNLQQDLDKANDIIEKDRQFYKCRMDEYVDLKKENERLKEDNLLIKSANKLVSDNLHNYKSRCQKATELLKLPIVYKTHQENGERDELLKRIRQAKDILNGVDENE